MGPEIWVGIVAIFVSGGAVGAVGALFSQWLLRRFASSSLPSSSPPHRERAALRLEISELARKLDNVDARLEFQEQLLGGSLQTLQPPPRLQPEPPEGGDRDDEHGA